MSYTDELEEQISNANLDPLRMKNKKQSYLKKMYFPHEEKNVYISSKVFMGMNLEDKRLFYLSIITPIRFVMLSMSGGGKTWLLRGIADRVSQEAICFFISDVKGEMISSNQPLQDKYKELLGKGEIPTAMNLVSLMPRFISKYSGLPKENIPYQLSLQDLELSDLITLFGLDEEVMTDKLNVLSAAYLEIEKNKIKTIADFRNYIVKNREIKEITKKWFQKALVTLESFDVIGEDSKVDLLDLMRENKNITLNLKGYEDVSLSWTRTYVAVILRKLYRIKRDGKIKKKLFIFMDEATDFIPKRTTPSSKKEALRIIDKGRLLGISMGFATQDIKRIDENVLKQSRYIFMNSTLTQDNFKEILKEVQLWDHFDTMYGTFIDKFMSLKRFQWCVVDREKKQDYWIKPPAPLSKHMEQSDYDNFYKVRY